MTSEAGVHKKGTFTFTDMIANVRNRTDFKNAGAIALFIGVVRGQTAKGERVQKLELEAYEEKANEVLANICRDLKEKEGITNVLIHHLLGDFNVGEDLVYVLVAGFHRKSVFPILEEAVDRYKSEVPIFKKEYIVDREGKTRSYWIGEHRDLVRE